MNLSLSFHGTIVSLLCVVFGVWAENLVLSSHVLAYVFVTLLTVLMSSCCCGLATE